MSNKIKTNIDLNKYRNNEIIKKLNLTDSEFRKYIFIIKQMVDQDDVSEFTTELIRVNDRLEIKTTIKHDVAQKLRIKNNYLIRSFADSELNITLTKDFFPTVDPSKAKILN
jgi:hypothetical protein